MKNREMGTLWKQIGQINRPEKISLNNNSKDSYSIDSRKN